MSITVKDAIRLMADEAERRGEDCNDSGGNVRAIVGAHGLDFYAWFCVCCELADRASVRRGFRNSAHEAFTLAERKTHAAQG